MVQNPYTRGGHREKRRWRRLCQGVCDAVEKGNLPALRYALNLVLQRICADSLCMSVMCFKTGRHAIKHNNLQMLKVAVKYAVKHGKYRFGMSFECVRKKLLRTAQRCNNPSALDYLNSDQIRNA